MKTSASVRQFLVSLLPALTDAQCDPVLLRNFESFPDEIGNDLDIFVRKQSLSEAFDILTRIAQENHGRVSHLHRRGYFVAVWLRFPDSEFPVHIDLYHGSLTWHGLPFLQDDELVRRANYGSDTFPYLIPAPAHEALVTTLASILWGGFFKSRYQERLDFLLKDDLEREAFSSILNKVFNGPGDVLAKVIVAGDAERFVIPALSNSLRKALWNSSIRRRPFLTVRQWLAHWSWEANCYLRSRPGMWLEYNSSICSENFPTELQRTVGAYFGDTKVIPKPALSGCKKFLTILRSRGKNHLVMFPSDRFSINGKSISVGQDHFKSFEEHLIVTLEARMHLSMTTA